MNLRSIVEALADYTVVLQPDRDVPEWWAGAPSVAVSPDGVFYLAARMREAGFKDVVIPEANQSFELNGANP